MMVGEITVNVSGVSGSGKTELIGIIEIAAQNEGFTVVSRNNEKHQLILRRGQ